MFRKDGLLPLEADILGTGIELASHGIAEFHAFGLATELREGKRARLLTAQGTLYKALHRLEERGLLTSRWEDVEVADDGRPRRRLYTVTAAGAAELARYEAVQVQPPLRVAPT